MTNGRDNFEGRTAATLEALKDGQDHMMEMLEKHLGHCRERHTGLIVKVGKHESAIAEVLRGQAKLWRAVYIVLGIASSIGASAGVIAVAL